MDVRSFVKRALPFAAMMMVECTEVAISTLSKAAMERGMSNFVFIVYSNALGTLILLPFFIFNSRKRAPLTFSLVCGFFLLGLNGTVGQLLVYIGVKYSSPALLSSMANLIPIFTFLLALTFRMEKLDLKRSSSQAKCWGTILSAAGAFTVTLYKGPILIISSTSSPSASNQLLSKESNWVLGGLLITIVCLLSAIWNIAQASIIQKYPEEMTVVFFFALFVTLESSIVSLFMESNPAAWRLRPDIEMVAIVFYAVFGTVFRITIHTWCLHKKGPVFVTMFKPLGIAIAGFTVVTFLGDSLYVGSVIGSSTIAVGFYILLWGKIKENKMGQENGLCSLESSSQKTPLLLNRSEEDV